MTMADVLRSPGGLLDRVLLSPSPPDDHSPSGRGSSNGDVTLPPPPPPPLGSSRLERLAYHSEGGLLDRSLMPPLPPDDHPPRGGRGSREDARLPPPPPLSSSSPERVIYRLEDDSPRSGKSSSPGGGRGRRQSPPRRSRPRSDDGGRRHSPPRRSSSPAQHKRPRLGDGASLLSPPRSGRYGRGGGRARLTITGRRSSDMPESGYDAPNNGQDITQRKGLMTYKQFIRLLEDDVSPAEAESRYREYETSYITTQKRAYFDLHKDEVWLKDKYHPTNLLPVIERRNEFCKAVANNLILDLRSGTLDIGPGFTAGTASKSGNDNDGSSEDEEDYCNKRRKDRRGPPKETRPVSTAPKAHPVSTQYRRIQADIDQTLALVQKLDSEKGIVGNILLTGDHGKSAVDRSRSGSLGPIVIVRSLSTVKGLEGVELLDTLLTYLWRVHGVDYYGMSEMKDAKGLRHVRADKKSAGAFNINATDWEKKLDSFWQERLLNGEDPLVVLTAKDKLDAATDEILKPYVRQVKDEKYGWKYGCGAKGCAKVFHAPEFVHKHLSLKHPDLVSVLTSRIEEDIYFKNYMNDPNAPGGMPVMQQSAPVGIPVMQQSDIMRRRADEQIFDDFGVQGSNAPPVHEFPIPPVLMPVPGAGQLGPFVPVPPEMAMHMMREQGPARPNGAPRGMKPVMPGPMIPMYPSFPRDPRPLRSYKDLDAPEEEVTVVDYRGL